MTRLHSLADLSTLFGPDAKAPVKKNGAEPKLSADKEDEMGNVARIYAGDTTKDGVVKGAAVQSVPYTLVERRVMSVAEWATIRDNPRQRDTEKHAARAKKQHLCELDPIHALVNMAETLSGERYKLDGHTRLFLWQRGELQAPDELLVDVWRCRDEEAVKQLYSRFDNQTAAETAVDRLRGALNEHNLNLISPMLRDGNFGTAIKRIYLIGWTLDEARWTTADFVYDAVGVFKRELQEFDALKPQPGRFPSGAIAAALVTMKRYGPASIEFWRAYAENQGTKDGPVMNGVQALSEKLEALKALKSGSGIYQQSHLMYAAFNAFEGWRVGKSFKSKRKLSLMQPQAARLYIKQAAKTTNVWPKPSPAERAGA